MANFWKGLETLSGHSAVACEWRRHMGEEFERVRNSFVIPTGEEATSFPSAQICECSLRVVKHAPDHIVGLSDCDLGGCNDVKLSPPEIAISELNWKKLGRAIAAALGCDYRESDLGIPGTKQIAAFGASSLPILLTIQHERHWFASAVSQALALLGKQFILLSPTSQFLDANSKGMIANARAGFFPLETILTVNANGTLQASKSAGELFSAFLPEAAAPVQKSEALRVFEIVRKLRSESGKEVAPLFDVFNYLVLDGLSQRQAAKKCDCSIGTMSLRVTALEERFELTIEQLRGFASDLKEMESTVKGDKYRRKSEGGRFESEEEAETESEEEEF